MLYRQFFLLVLGIAIGLSSQAQTQKTLIGAPQKSSAYKPVKTKPRAAVKKTDTAIKDTTKATAVAMKETTDLVRSEPPAIERTPAPATVAVTISEPAATAPAAAMTSPFEAGTLRLSNQSKITMHRFDHGDLDKGKDNDLAANLSATWFLTDGLGIGVDARYSKSYYTTPGTSSDFSSWSTYFHLMYGYSFTERYHAFAKVGWGPSKSNSKTKISQNNNQLRSSYNDLAASIGGLMRLEEKGQLFLTSSFSYDQYKGTAGGHDIKDKTFGFLIRLESYLPLASTEKKQHTNYYAKGSQFIDYNSHFDWHGTTRNEKQGNIAFVPRKYNTRLLHAGYGLYVVDNIAAGLNLEISHIKNTTPGSPADVRNYVSLQPSVLAQVPVESPLNHLFGQVSYEYSRGKESGQVKTKESNFDFRVGYHLFMAKNLALTPRIGYSIYNNTRTFVTSGDIKRKSTGIAGELVLRAWLDWKWLK